MCVCVCIVQTIFLYVTLTRRLTRGGVSVENALGNRKLKTSIETPLILYYNCAFIDRYLSVIKIDLLWVGRTVER